MTRNRFAAPLAAAVCLSVLLPPAPSGAAEAPVAAEVWGRSAIPLGDPAFTADGRLVTSHHPAFATAERVSVFAAPRPAGALSGRRLERRPVRPRPTSTACRASTRIRRACCGWATLGEREKAVPKVVGWDTKANRLARTIMLPPPATLPSSEPQDLVVDETPRPHRAGRRGHGAGR